MPEIRDKQWWRQYRADKKDAINARARKWNKANRDKRNAIQRRYRAKRAVHNSVNNGDTSKEALTAAGDAGDDPTGPAEDHQTSISAFGLN